MQGKTHLSLLLCVCVCVCEWVCVYVCMTVKEVWNYHKGRYVTYLVRTQYSGSKPQEQVPLPYYWMTHQAAAIFVARQHSANLPLCYAGIPSSVASLSILLLPPMIYLPPVPTYKTNIDVIHTNTHTYMVYAKICRWVTNYPQCTI